MSDLYYLGKTRIIHCVTQNAYHIILIVNLKLLDLSLKISKVIKRVYSHQAKVKKDRKTIKKIKKLLS